MEQTQERTYYCHSCRSETRASLPFLQCPNCNSEFIEEVDLVDPPTVPPTVNPPPPFTQQPQPAGNPPPFFHPGVPPFVLPQGRGLPIINQLLEQLSAAMHQQAQTVMNNNNNTNNSTNNINNGNNNPQVTFADNNRVIFRQNLTFPLHVLIGNMNGGMGFVGNPGDYANGNWEAMMNQLFQNSAYRGTPPAAKTEVTNLKRLHIEQQHVDNKLDCAICTDEFELSNEVIEMPCTHIFHPECILHWLEIHNSCPVCRMELRTDDSDYETRRSAQQQQQQTTQTQNNSTQNTSPQNNS